MSSQEKLRIGFLAIDLTNTFNEILLEGVRNRCQELDVELIVFHGGRINAPEELEKTQNILYSYMMESRLSGLLFSNVFSFLGESALNDFLKPFEGLPKAFLIQETGFGPTIKVRNSDGFRELVLHLVRDQNCRSIGAITGPEFNPDSAERLDTLKEVLAESGVPFGNSQIAKGDFSLHSGSNGVRELIIDRGLVLDALICFNDNMAVGAVRELQALEMRIPQDILVSGFDDTLESRNLNPPLTTVSFPMYHLGAKGVDTLMSVISGEDVSSEISLSTEFIPRRSTGFHAMESWLWHGTKLPGELLLRGPCTTIEQMKAQITGDWFEVFVSWFFKNIRVSFTKRTRQYFRLVFYDFFEKVFRSFVQHGDDHWSDFVEELLEEEVLRGRSLDNWDKVFGALFHIMAGVIPEEHANKLSRLFQSLIPQIQKFQRNQILYENIYERHRSQIIYRIGQELGTCFDMQEIPAILAKSMPELGIQYCIGVLFDSENHENIKVLFHIQDGRIVPLSQETTSRKDFLEKLPTSVKRPLLLETLNIGEEAMGFMVFGVKEKLGLVFRSLRHQISSTIKASSLMSQIQNYTGELEDLVHDRTQALLDANKVLKKEMDDRIRMEKTILKQKNLESLGILAGGIAHDFNNLLTGILGNVSLLELGGMEEEEMLHCFGDIMEAGKQARSLTQQLLTFSKGGAPIKEQLDLVELVTNTARFHLRGSKILSHFDFDDHLPHVEVDSGQLSQVINNIVVNAIQVMPKGGEIRFQGRMIKVAGDHAVLAPGTYLQLDISDTGPGIPREIVEKVFDPYFTTKKRGSGLGLATSLAIIRRHQGEITVDSIPDQGTTFHLFLPIVKKEGSKRKPKGKGRVFLDQKRILVLEDELPIQRVFDKLLTTLGHEVTVLGDGELVLEEFEKAKKAGTPYDLLVMDLTVPGGMGGEPTMAKLKESHPEAIAIVTSGYSDTPVMAAPEKFGFSAILKKPFTLKDLSSSISRALGSENS